MSSTPIKKELVFVYKYEHVFYFKLSTYFFLEQSISHTDGEYVVVLAALKSYRWD